MKPIVRILSLILCLAVLTGLVPASAAGGGTDIPSGSGDAKVVRRSGDYGHGYYVVFEYNGRQYRSDIAGSEINYSLWLKCSDTDRKNIALNFAFARTVMEDQFGADHTAEIFNWANDPWKKATELLKKRIAERDFPVLAHIYESELSYYERAKINETAGYDLSQYLFLPEVRQYQEIENNMKEVYDCGRRCYGTLKEAKMTQTSIAVKTISSGLIELITDRAMVPAMTPGGLSGLMPDVKGELIGLVENLTGLQGELKAMVIGEKPDPNMARLYINYYWRVINTYESLGNACVDQFLGLKARKQEAYDQAVAAVKAWKEKEETAYQEATERGEEASGVSVSPVGSGDIDLDAAYEALYKEYKQWQQGVTSMEEGTVAWDLNKKLTKIREGALTYDGGWPFMCQYDGTNPVIYDMDKLESDAYPVWQLANSSGWTVYVEGSGDAVYGTWDDWNNDLAPKHNRYYHLRTAIPEALAGAIQEAQEKITALTDYQEGFDSTLDRLQSEWSDYKARFLGLNQAAEALTGVANRYSVPDPGFDYLCQQYGSTAAFLEQLKDYKSKLETVQTSWKEDSAALEEEARKQADLYLEQQKTVLSVSDRYSGVFREYRELLAETQALYFDGSRSKGLAALVSDEKQAEADRGRSEGKRIQEIYAEWGRDLSDRLARLQALKLEQQELWDDRLNAIAICKGICLTTDFLLLNDHCPEAGLLSPERLQRLPLDTGDASLHEAGAVLQDGDARRNVHADRFPSLENVRRACREFTGMNELSLAFDENAVEVLSWKPAYMRASEEERKAMVEQARELLSFGSLDWNVRQRYAYGETILLDSVDAVFNRFEKQYEGSWEWELANGAYTPVTGLDGPKTLPAADSTLTPGETLDLSKQVRVLPADASGRDLIWESSDIDVCTVDENGKVTPTGCGRAVITVRAADSVRTENGDGTFTYSPAPLTWTVSAGSGKTPTDYGNVNSIWKNFGTEESPRLYDVTTDKTGVRSVLCAVSPLTVDRLHIAVTLTNSEGKMLDLAFLTCDEQAADFRTVALRGKDAGTLRLRAFAVSADGSLRPYDGVMLLNEEIP